MTRNILIVDDEANYRRVLTMMLMDLPGVHTAEAQDGAAALTHVDNNPIDLVITDVNMPQMDGLTLLKTLKQRAHAPSVVVVTAYSSISAAVEAMQLGAIDYLQKPFDEQRLKLTVQRALQISDLLQENQRLRDDVRARHDFAAILGDSDALKAAMRVAAKVAAADSTVLLVGESGSGKELFARAIHLNSKRKQGPFVALNCAAVPEGLLEAELFGAEAGAYTGAHKKRRGRVELARGGTLFLDEIGDMPTALQAKLLRLLQERTFQPLGAEKEEHADVRFIFATHRDLASEVQAGRFREDLRFRVSVLPVLLPPLRERGDDVMLLARELCARVCDSMGKKPLPFSAAAERTLLQHRWPGNVRELSNVVERAVILCEGVVIDAFDLDLPIAQAPMVATSTGASTWTLPEEGLSLEHLERDLVRQALARTKGNKSQAARLLGLSRATLRYRIEKLDLVDPGSDADP